MAASVYQSKEKEIDAKVREIFGDKEADKMHEEIVKDRLEKAPEPLPTYGGTAILDSVTNQYIYMAIEDIEARLNRINDRINKDYDFSKDEWCDMFNEENILTDPRLFYEKEIETLRYNNQYNPGWSEV